MTSLEKYLDSLAEKGLLKREPGIKVDQIQGLLDGSRRNLRSANKSLEIDEELCYEAAYKSMFKLARAMVFLQGYRTDDGGQHKTTINVAEKVLGAAFGTLIKKFDKMRRIRNAFDYDPGAPLSRIETVNALKTANEFYDKVIKYLMTKNPQLKLI